MSNAHTPLLHERPCHASSQTHIHSYVLVWFGKDGILHQIPFIFHRKRKRRRYSLWILLLLLVLMILPSNGQKFASIMKSRKVAKVFLNLLSRKVPFSLHNTKRRISER